MLQLIQKLYDVYDNCHIILSLQISQTTTHSNIDNVNIVICQINEFLEDITWCGEAVRLGFLGQHAW
uniref:Uncharacterized protein n=1 Tax=Arion vulgaris TaxID=1028688 RepID=A0A0B7AW62_9EUPU